MVLLPWLALAHAQTVALEHRIPTTTEVGASATAVGGVDQWSDAASGLEGGGPSGEARMSLGAAHGWRRSRASAGYGGLFQGWLDPSAVDGHLVQLGLGHATGPGLRATGRGSVAQRWTEANGAVGVYRSQWLVQAGPLVRVGTAPTTAGGFAQVAADSRPTDRVELSAAVRGALHVPDAVPSTGVARLTAVFDPTLSVQLGLGASGLVAGRGDPISLLGLPPGESQLVRGEAWLIGWVSRGLALQAEAAVERALGSVDYLRGRVFGGIHLRVGRSGTPSTEQAPGTTRFEVTWPEAQDVALAGSFTNWEPVPMQREDTRWSVEIPLPPGVHEYVYLVDGIARVPPEATSTRDDGFGGRNGVVVVGDPSM